MRESKIWRLLSWEAPKQAFFLFTFVRYVGWLSFTIGPSQVVIIFLLFFLGHKWKISLRREGNNRDNPPPSQWGAQPCTQPKKLTHKAPLKAMVSQVNKATPSITYHFVPAPAFIKVLRVFIFSIGTCLHKFMHFAHAILP